MISGQIRAPSSGPRRSHLMKRCSNRPVDNDCGQSYSFFRGANEGEPIRQLAFAGFGSKKRLSLKKGFSSPFQDSTAKK